MSDALKRRCLHLYIPFPDATLENRIVLSQVPEVADGLRRQMVRFIQELRELDLKKPPAVSETIDWARTLLLLHAHSLDESVVRATLNVLLKFEDDIQSVGDSLNGLITRARSETI